MSRARILDVCDAVASHLRTLWTDRGRDDAVTREYGPDVGLTKDDEDSLIAGRQVYVFPAAYAVPRLVTRREMERGYTVAVLCVERYTDDPPTEARPPAAWMDERVTFVERMFKALRDPDLTLIGSVIPALEDGGDVAKVDVVYDLDVFVRHRAFWSQLTAPFEEVCEL
ncbi:MAG: hypothetical protein K2P78_04115 [Gemmataceae bacterium]|nr:hypothetical protein [Gemmataceae bacterium]